MIVTRHLTLVPASVALARAELHDRPAFAELLGAVVPDAWPPQSTVDALPLFLGWLEAAPPVERSGLPGAIHDGLVFVGLLPAESEDHLIKRVIGLPGDTIETRDGAVYIDDRKLDEPYLPAGTLTGDPNAGTNPEIPRQVVPKGTVVSPST
jgi:hypothetical protein